MFDIFINGDGTDGIGNDAATDGVLDFSNSPLDGCINLLAILEGAVAGSIEGAVLEDDAIDVTERLFTGDMAAYKSDRKSVV